MGKKRERRLLSSVPVVAYTGETGSQLLGDSINPAGGVPTANHNLQKGQIFVKGKTDWHFFLFKPQPPQLTTEAVHNWEVKSRPTQRGDHS